jgi:23S rRNA (uracil1939-C5)-methyltransferase
MEPEGGVLKAGDILPLAVERPAAGGRMIARVDGQVVLVADAIPGERVQARIERVGKGVAYAQTLAVEERSADRRDPFADPLCGGCLYSHIAYPRQLEIKGEVIADAFRRIGRVALPGPVAVAGSPEDGYRMRARLHVRGHRLGFFRENSHDVCDARATRQLLPATVDALERLMAAMRSLGLDAVREIELSENIDATSRVVFLDASAVVDASTLERLAGTDGLTGLGSAFGAYGSPYVTDSLTIGVHSLMLRRHVQAFFQGNRHLLGSLVAHVAGQVPNGGAVLDLYAGVGLFSVAAAIVRGARVLAVEGDAYAADDLHANGAAAGGRITAIRGAVESIGSQLSSWRRTPGGPAIETVIVDPPRTGLSREAMESVLALAAPRLIYVSCDVATLARDARRFVDDGCAIERIDGFDLFPNTPHVETVVVFTRVNSSS